LKETLRNLTRSQFIRWPVLAVMGAAELVVRAVNVLRTAALFPQALELPRCHWSVTVKCRSRIKLGRGVIIGPKCTLGAAGGITFGDHVRLSEGVMIETAGLDFTGKPPYPHVHRPIVLEDGVWVGARAIILAGVTIGAQSVIGAGAVVSHSVPPDSIVVGSGVRDRTRRDGVFNALADKHR
jgi:acetyltransferase-like isoleucine patch superfamily enzyme